MGWGRPGLATTGDLREWNAQILESEKLQEESCSSVDPLPKCQTTMTRGRAAHPRKTHVANQRADDLDCKEKKSNDDRAKSRPKYMKNQMANLSADGFMWV